MYKPTISRKLDVWYTTIRLPSANHPRGFSTSIPEGVCSMPVIILDRILKPLRDRPGVVFLQTPASAAVSFCAMQLHVRVFHAVYFMFAPECARCLCSSACMWVGLMGDGGLAWDTGASYRQVMYCGG
ncbi:unnamed protein product [Ascophyllum nodosum]